MGFRSTDKVQYEHHKCDMENAANYIDWFF